MPRPKVEPETGSSLKTSFTLDADIVRAARSIAEEEGFKNSFSAWIVSLIKAKVKATNPPHMDGATIAPSEVSTAGAKQALKTAHKPRSSDSRSPRKQHKSA